MLLHSAGTRPRSSFTLRSTLHSHSIEPHSAGSVPLSALRDTFRNSSCVTVLHSAGSVPLSALSPRFSVSRAERPLHAAGSGPVSALPCSCTSVSRVRRPQLAGSVPDRLLPSPPARMRVTSTLALSTLSPSSGSASGAVGRSACRSSVTLLYSHVTYVHVQKSIPVHASASVDPGVTKLCRNVSVFVCSASV
ncbi:hypothetical protein NESM_000938600 [Novymonas esmeraldas]|uniref:Uncharacterized protein n=1 Tax=Novymonas esmeraldas TaxID=1808958 RepID=A0AAW0F2Z9_9TRYP